MTNYGSLTRVVGNGEGRIFIFVNGGSADWWELIAVSQDGESLAGHICSSPSWGVHDMGIQGDWKHDHYLEKYPAGFTLEWVDDPKLHPVLGMLVLAARANDTGGAK